jgi:hypothetical protein
VFACCFRSTQSILLSIAAREIYVSITVSVFECCPMWQTLWENSYSFVNSIINISCYQCHIAKAFFPRHIHTDVQHMKYTRDMTALIMRLSVAFSSGAEKDVKECMFSYSRMNIKRHLSRTRINK